MSGSSGTTDVYSLADRLFAASEAINPPGIARGRQTRAAYCADRPWTFPEQLAKNACFDALVVTTRKAKVAAPSTTPDLARTVVRDRDWHLS